MSSGSDEDQPRYETDSSDSEPELECDQWDADCTILPSRQAPNSPGAPITNLPSPGPPKRSKRCYTIRPTVAKSTQQLKTHFGAQKPWKNDIFEVISEPFRVCVVDNFIAGDFWLPELLRELYEVPFNLRHLDLYEFFQSEDLRHLRSPAIEEMRRFLNEDLKQWVSSITGSDLTDLSATCSLYTNSDYLLAHDDQKGDRKIAFILYLTDQTSGGGGALQLIDKRDETARNLPPRKNQLVFFPVVTDKSYHRVEEIRGLNECRLSINGWFHTKTPPVSEAPIYQPLGIFGPHYSNPQKFEIDLKSWINPEYLSNESITRIQRHVEDNSEISLGDFFLPEAFDAVAAQLSAVTWTKRGPVNRLNYEVADQMPPSIERLLALFRSEQIFALLHRFTQLDLIGVKLELQKWTPGSYTLLNEYDWSKPELDLAVYFGCDRSGAVIGARTHYVTVEDPVQQALITLEPVENILNLIYRDSARFTKYFSEQSRCKVFYKLICCYTE